MGQGTGLRGWSAAGGGAAAPGGVVDRETVEDLLSASYVSPLASLNIAYDDAGNRFTFDINLAHSNTWTVQQLFQGDGGASISAGGAINVAGFGTGAGVVIYSSRGADAAGRALVVNQDNVLNPQQAVRVANAGTGHAVSIAQTGTGGEALDVVSTDRTTSAFGITGVESARGTAKITHSHPAAAVANDDANAAILRLNWEDQAANGTAVQGIVLQSEPAGPVTTGDLMRLYSGPVATAANLRTRVTSQGALRVNENTANLIGVGLHLGTTFELNQRLAGRATATRRDAGDMEFHVSNLWNDTAAERNVDLVLGYADAAYWRLRKDTTVAGREVGTHGDLKIIDERDASFIFRIAAGDWNQLPAPVPGKIEISETNTGAVAPVNAATLLSLYATASGTFDMPNSTDLGAQALRAQATLNQTGTGLGASALPFASVAIITQARHRNNEVGHLFTSADNSAAGTPHAYVWGMDVDIIGNPTPTESNSGLVNSVFAARHNSYMYNEGVPDVDANGNSPVGPSVALAVGTRQGRSLAGHTVPVNRSVLATGPIEHGIQVWGTAGTTPAGTTYGFKHGLRLGGKGAIYNPGEGSWLLKALYATDWDQYGIHIGARVAGAAAANPRAIRVDSGHIDLAATDGAVMHSRLTTAQRDALIDITNGMLIYNTSTLQFEGYENGAWVDFHEAATVAITQVTVDFGATPIHEKTFVITDAACLANSKILIASVTASTADGKPDDDAFLEDLWWSVDPDAGSFDFYLRGGNNDLLVGKYLVNYAIG